MSLSPGVTMLLATALWTFLRALLFGSAAIALENLALRHQLVVLQRAVARPRLSRVDRIFWVWLSCLWASWRSSLVIVQPATVLAWHRKGFQLYWRWKSRANPVGRPSLDLEIRRLIPAYGSRESNVGPPAHPGGARPARLPRRRAHGGQVHAAVVLTPHPDVARLSKGPHHDIVAVDFFVVPTITFRLLFVFVVLRHDRRELIHLNVTDHPTAAWTTRQIIEAFPEETAPKYLLRDRDAVYGEAFTRCVATMGIRQVITAPRAPWQNPFVERVIGSIRRECLDHFVVLSDAHLRRLLHSYRAYYNHSRPHQGLENNSPIPRDVQTSSRGRIYAAAEVGGLHHRYQRVA